jgi:tyrosyl-tRNA synthetase
MNWLFDEPMPIDKVHGFLLKPHDISAPEFGKLLSFLGINYKLVRILDRIITDDEGNIDDFWNHLIKIKFMDSRGDIRKLIKNQGLSINQTKVKENTVLDKSMFFSTGWKVDDDDVKFFVIRKGKMDCDIILGLFPT